MSILQEYEMIRKSLSDQQNQDIDTYLDEHPDILLSDILYDRKQWELFEKWEKEKHREEILLLNISEIDELSYSDYDLSDQLDDYYKLENKILSGAKIIKEDTKDVYNDVETLPFSRDGYNRYLINNRYVLENGQTGDRFIVTKEFNDSIIKRMCDLATEINEVVEEWKQEKQNSVSL